MVIDFTITIGSILEISVILGGGVMALISMKGMVTTLKADVYAMQSEITKLAQVLTEMAVANNRLNRVEEDIRELKHYKGFVNVDPPACLDMNCPVRRPPSK